jgi:prevent-host-death family protein
VKSASITKLIAHFTSILEQADSEPLIITRKGKPVAVLVAVADKADLERLIQVNSRATKNKGERRAANGAK